jgi:hypothetical protein
MISALILVGNALPNDDGNRAFAQICFEEADRPVFLLEWIRHLETTGKGGFRPFRMIPTIENTLDDSVLMIAYAVCKSPSIVEMVNSSAKNHPDATNRLSMYEDFSDSQRRSLYAALKKLDNLPKITWCLFKDSHLLSSVNHLCEYKFECEVTQSVLTLGQRIER